MINILGTPKEFAAKRISKKSLEKFEEGLKIASELLFNMLGTYFFRNTKVNIGLESKCPYSKPKSGYIAGWYNPRFTKSVYVTTKELNNVDSTSWDVARTIIHEIGHQLHHIHLDFDPTIALSKFGKTEYANENYMEDFAEAFADLIVQNHSEPDNQLKSLRHEQAYLIITKQFDIKTLCQIEDQRITALRLMGRGVDEPKIATDEPKEEGDNTMIRELKTPEKFTCKRFQKGMLEKFESAKGIAESLLFNMFDAEILQGIEVDIAPPYRRSSNGYIAGWFNRLTPDKIYVSTLGISNRTDVWVIARTIIHEVGHLLHYKFYGMSEIDTLSESGKTKYAYNNHREDFAEAFADMIMQNHPEADNLLKSKRHRQIHHALECELGLELLDTVENQRGLSVQLHNAMTEIAEAAAEAKIKAESEARREARTAAKAEARAEAAAARAAIVKPKPEIKKEVETNREKFARIARDSHKIAKLMKSKDSSIDYRTQYGLIFKELYKNDNFEEIIKEWA